jgi:hypothetical protein
MLTPFLFCHSLFQFAVPRLLAAMYFVAVRQGGTSNCWFDVVTQLVRTKQLIATRSTPFRHPILQIPGFSTAAFDAVTSKLLQKCKDTNGKMSFWAFRREPKTKVVDACKQTRKGTFKKTFTTVLDSVYSLPLVAVKNAKIYHEIGKTDGKGIGTLKLSLSIQREKSKNEGKDDMCSLNLVLGSFEKGKLLAWKEIPLSQKGDSTANHELQFDWKTANVYGGLDGGHVILRLLLDTARGLDSEVAIPLK